MYLPLIYEIYCRVAEDQLGHDMSAAELLQVTKQPNSLLLRQQTVDFGAIISTADVRSDGSNNKLTNTVSRSNLYFRRIHTSSTLIYSE